MLILCKLTYNKNMLIQNLQYDDIIVNIVTLLKETADRIRGFDHCIWDKNTLKDILINISQ